MRTCASVLRLAAAASVLAVTVLAGDWSDVRPRRTNDYNESRENGYCIIRLRVDNEVVVHVRGDRVAFETIVGQRARDEGTECSQPMPSGSGLSNFRFRGIDGRGDVQLIEPPESGNRYTARVRIRDTKGGDEGYTFKLEWDNRGGYAGRGNGGGWGNGNGNGNGRGGGWGNGNGNGNGNGWGNGRASGQSRDTLNTTTRGRGLLEIRNGNSSDLDEVRVDLNGSGDFRLEFKGRDGRYGFGGRWTRSGNAIDLEIRDGADGNGRIGLRGGAIQNIRLQGRNQQGNRDFRINFDAN